MTRWHVGHVTADDVRLLAACREVERARRWRHVRRVAAGLGAVARVLGVGARVAALVAAGLVCPAVLPLWLALRLYRATHSPE